MRIKFQLGNVEYDEFTVVIIINVTGRIMGIVVDGVSDVISLDQEQIRSTPEFGSVIDIEYITGLGAVEDRMLILVDIEKLIGSMNMDVINQ